MAAFYVDIVSTRTTAVDEGALLATMRGVDPTIGFYTTDGRTLFHVKKATAWTTPQIAQAQSAIDNAPALTQQRAAQNIIDGWDIATRSLVLALIDQLNVLRADITTLGISRPPITAAAALAATRAKAGTLS